MIVVEFFYLVVKYMFVGCFRFGRCFVGKYVVFWFGWVIRLLF